MIVYVDVDNTLIRTIGEQQHPISEVVNHLRQLNADGVQLFCWSAGGADYAKKCAQVAGVEDLFAAFLPKPRVMIDDQFVTDWPFCVTVHPEWCRGKKWEDYLSTDLDTGILNR